MAKLTTALARLLLVASQKIEQQPPVLTTMDNPNVRQARIDEIRRMTSRRSSRSTRLTEFGDVSMTAGRKTLLGS